MRLSAYQSLFYYYSMDLEDDEIRQMVNEWLEGWLKVRKGSKEWQTVLKKRSANRIDARTAYRHRQLSKKYVEMVISMWQEPTHFNFRGLFRGP